MFHSQADPGDEHTLDEEAGTSASSRLQERLTKAVEVFEAYRDGRAFIHRVNLEILRKMCTDRGLSVTGQKAELLGKLKEWVSQLYHIFIDMEFTDFSAKVLFPNLRL